MPKKESILPKEESFKEELKIEYIDISKLKPYKNNPRLNEEAVKAVKKSIKQYGFKNPLIVDLELNICAGHTRILAVQELLKEGFKFEDEEINNNKIPVIKSKFTKNDFIGFNIADNQTASIAGWEETKLAKLIEELQNEDFDVSSLGFESKEIERLLQGLDGERKGLTDDDEIPPLPKKAITKMGDLWQLGEHRLLCGDSIKEGDMKILMNKNSINLCFTSPPYNMNSSLYENFRDNLKSEEFINFNLQVVKNVKKFLKGFIFWNLSYNKNSKQEFIEIYYKIIKEEGLYFVENIIWDKTSSLPNNSNMGLTRTYETILNMGDNEENFEYNFLGTNLKKYILFKKTAQIMNNYWRIPNINIQLKNLKACFPVKLPEKAILLTTQKKDKVLDPFGGSGSTLIACEKTNRICYMMEIDPLYVDVIVQRWEDYTGKKAVLLNQEKKKILNKRLVS